MQELFCKRKHCIGRGDFMSHDRISRAIDLMKLGRAEPFTLRSARDELGCRYQTTANIVDDLVSGGVLLDLGPMEALRYCLAGKTPTGYVLSPVWGGKTPTGYVLPPFWGCGIY